MPLWLRNYRICDNIPMYDIYSQHSDVGLGIDRPWFLPFNARLSVDDRKRSPRDRRLWRAVAKASRCKSQCFATEIVFTKSAALIRPFPPSAHGPSRPCAGSRHLRQRNARIGRRLCENSRRPVSGRNFAAPTLQKVRELQQTIVSSWW
jgi:hypothetical protein